MDEAWKQLPCAAVIVCASVLGSSSARAEQPEATEPSAAPVDPYNSPGPAPTCGPSCHGGYEPPPPPPPDDDHTAPTCGPSCHGGGSGGGDERFAAPPPVEPPKQGCAVEDAHDDSPLALAALSLGLLAGVGARRRRDDEASS